MDKLLEVAKNARENAYAPYSKFKVGAVLKTKDGRIYKGANVENASYGLTNCAERTALFSAYADGVRKTDIESFLIIGDTKAPISPCGACRQVMSELLAKETKITLANIKGNTKEVTISELMPMPFEEVEND